MKPSFKSFLLETEFNGIPNFYHLYFTEFPSQGVKKMKAGPEKDKQLEIEQVRFKNLLTDNLRLRNAADR